MISKQRFHFLLASRQHDALLALGYSVRELRAAGYSARELLDAGYSARELLDAGYSAGELRDAGYSAGELLAAGYTAGELLDAGYSAGDLRDAGYSAGDLLALGYTAGELLALGFSARELRDAGYDLSAEIAQAPAVDKPYSLIHAQIVAGERKLSQGAWGPDTPPEHICDTPMCIAGSLVNIAGPEGYELKDREGWVMAATLIHMRAHPDIPPPSFGAYADEIARDYIAEMAAIEAGDAEPQATKAEER